MMVSYMSTLSCDGAFPERDRKGHCSGSWFLTEVVKCMGNQDNVQWHSEQKSLNIKTAA